MPRKKIGRKKRPGRRRMSPEEAAITARARWEKIPPEQRSLDAALRAKRAWATRRKGIKLNFELREAAAKASAEAKRKILDEHEG